VIELLCALVSQFPISSRSFAKMKSFAIFFMLAGIGAAKPFSSVETRSAAQCGAPNDNVCAQFVFANGTVSQDIHLHDDGCTEVAHSDAISGIKVYDCWCGLWK
jgi:hypothetical protein